VEFLRLMGVKLNSSVAASVTLRFTLSRAQNKPLIFQRIRVTLSRRPAVENLRQYSSLSKTVTIPAGQTEINTIAYHCEMCRRGNWPGRPQGLPGLHGNSAPPAFVARRNKGWNSS